MQKSIDLLKNEIFSLPKTIGTNDIVGFASKCFNEYLTFIDTFDGDIKELVAKDKFKIQKFCDKAIAALNFYLKGNIAHAYFEIGEGVDALKDYLYLPNNNRIYIANGIKTEFYRIRHSEEPIQNIKEELFHIPFEKRDKVNSYRYSISGLPCLYLSNSVELCWRELRQPDIGKIYVSRFEFNLNDFRFMYLVHNPIEIANICQLTLEKGIGDSLIIDYLKTVIFTWPVAFCCSIVSANDGAKFKSEYILPQLIFQYIRDFHNADGVYYFSNRVNYSLNTLNPTSENLAIPVSSVNRNGFCDNLSSKIKLTDPISYSDLNFDEPTKEAIDKWIELSNNGYLMQMISNGKSRKNEYSDFSRFEIALCMRETKTIIPAPNTV